MLKVLGGDNEELAVNGVRSDRGLHCRFSSRLRRADEGCDRTSKELKLAQVC